jgi:hypothetical protein
MKKKTTSLKDFIEKLHNFIVKHPQFRKDTSLKSEGQIQTEIRPLIIQYLENYFKERGYKDYTAKANQSFYWEGQEGRFGREHASTFGSRNYPDFIITEPYLIAIEYKKNTSGSLVKHGIGQSIIHTMCGDFDFVYFLFHDENNDERIKEASENELEKEILGKLWQKFNVYIKFV